jgi:hypothetical protein
MKLKTFLLTVVAVIGFCSSSFAGGNSVSISVSCTVPAIPGVNVPFQESRQIAMVVGQDKTDSGRKIQVRTFYPL